MIRRGQTYVNARSGGTISILEHWDDTAGERAVLQRMMPAGTGYVGPHIHLDFDQVWEVREGQAHIEVDGGERVLNPGQRIEIPRGTDHRDPWNLGPADLVVQGELEPVTEFARVYLETYVKQAEAGALNEQDEMPLLQLTVIWKETDGESFAATPPVAIQRVIGPARAAFGRLRGYRATYD